jgi:hypothetical protein
MKTKDLILLAVGVGIGYLSIKTYGRKKAETQAKDMAKDMADTLAKKTSECQDKWDKQASTMRFAQGAIEGARANFIAGCLNPTVPETTK